ncbi:MAG: Holliday junction resolvase RuvX [Eubacteriales bacterium]|nr:Holliday junction resolvase RuvX [Eubacteriales bacterium]
MRIMAIDYGDAHTGVAISDPTGMLAGWTTTIDSRKQDVVVEQLRAIIAQWQVTELVLGYPKNMNDTKGERVLKSEGLAQRLTEETGLPVHLWDERLTTVDAHRILSENGRRGKKRKQKVDAVAATLILEGYLGFRRNQKERE